MKQELVTQILTVPGWEGSDANHWQSHWERIDPSVRRVEQLDWAQPVLSSWSRRLVELASRGPTVLAAHSLGAVLVAHAAPRLSTVVGALLVAPPDLSAAPAALRSFAPVPRAPLPFRSVVVASHDDRWSSIQWSRELSCAWGADFVDAGNAGHLNGQSGLGTWPAGLELLRRVSAPRVRS